MPAMDALPLLENLGIKVILKGKGIGKVKKQSLKSGSLINKNKSIEIFIE